MSCSRASSVFLDSLVYSVRHQPTQDQRPAPAVHCVCYVQYDILVPRHVLLSTWCPPAAAAAAMQGYSRRWAVHNHHEPQLCHNHHLQQNRGALSSPVPVRYGRLAGDTLRRRASRPRHGASGRRKGHPERPQPGRCECISGGSATQRAGLQDRRSICLWAVQNGDHVRTGGRLLGDGL